MNKNELINQLSQDIIGYVMSGSLKNREIARQIKPGDLNERFEDYELLLDLHFILKDDVVNFVRRLPQRIRNIRTETESVSKTRRGTVDGHINWGATVKKRYSQNPRDNSLFVCDNRSEDYDISENVVLKRLISVIYSTIDQSNGYLKSEYNWASNTWRGEEELIDELERIVERNVHVKRIRDPETYEPTERMLITAESSRQTIYQDAARLLRTRQRLHQGDQEELKQLLDNTAITPDDDGKLFELFVLFRFVAVLEDMFDQQPNFNTITTGQKEIAKFDGDPELVLYHDKSAKDRDLSFRTEEEVTGRLKTRSEKVQEVAHSVASTYFQTDFQNQTGRPDIIVLEINDKSTDDYEYLITEAKYRTGTDRIRQGIKESLEYLAFLRLEGQFVFGDESNEDYFGSGWNGLLVTQDLNQETASFEEQKDSEIKILQASELSSQLQSVIGNAF